MTSGGAFLMDARAAKDLDELIDVDDLTNRIEFPRPGSASSPTLAGSFDSIELKQVYFAFIPGRPIIEGLSFRFRQGKSYAIVGPSGSGKSTLADLLMGMLTPADGQIMLNGEASSPEQLRKLSVLVEQQPRIFSVSLRENLTLGLQVSDAEINEVIDTVDLAEFVRALPRGVQTLLEYQGSNLSGGQRQRLSIARALLRRPRILILDEATSALDPLTRDRVVKKIRLRLDQCTLIFITHDETFTEIVDEVLSL